MIFYWWKEKPVLSRNLLAIQSILFHFVKQHSYTYDHLLKPDYEQIERRTVVCFAWFSTLFFSLLSFPRSFLLIHVCHPQSSKYSFSYLQIVKSAQQDKTRQDHSNHVFEIV